MELINQEALKNWTGISQPKRLMRWLTDNGINYLNAPGGIVTTQAAVDAALLKDSANDPVEF